MLTGKQRAYLRSLAAGLDTIFQFGKGGVSGEAVSQLSNALEARELIKCRVLGNSGLDAYETANELASLLHAEVVQVIGTRFSLYRPSEKLKNSPKKIQLDGHKESKK